MSAVRTERAAVAPEPARRGTGVTVRPPRVLVANQPRADEPPTGTYVRVPEPATVVYRMASEPHWQTGVVAEVSVDDYRAGRIRRHEATHPDRVRRLDEFTESAGTEQVPVTLTYRGGDALHSLLAEVAAGRPEVHVTSADGLAHTVWTAQDAELAHAVQHELDRIDTLYIADGHHRMAAAERYADRRGANVAFTLAALFPSAEMRILGYHRCVQLPDGMSTSDLVEALAAQPVVERIEECTAGQRPRRGVLVVHVDGRWYQLRLRTPRDPVNVRAALDVVLLDEGILGPVLGVPDAEADSQVTPLSDAAAVSRWCAEQHAVGFLLHPPTVEQVMAVSDAGLVMPPKSTWFEPKAAAGLFLRELG